MMEELLEKLASKVSEIPESLPETSRPVALEFLRKADDDTSASVLYAATRVAYGKEMLSWEPETLWLTMEEDKIDLSLANRDKLMAAISIIVNPQAYWDHIVFENVVQAFAGYVSNPDVIQESHPADISWAIFEMDTLRRMDPDGRGHIEFDEDVQQYMAVCLQRAGFVCVPDNMVIVEDNLASLQPSEAKNLRTEVREAWKKLDKKALPRTEFAENAVGVGLARLAGCYLTVEDRAKAMGADFLSLKA
jgi:hypothetical protein